MRVKVVPGASRSKIVGLLGDRLKVAVAAPAEGGRANQAVRELLAEAFGVPVGNALVSAGPTQPRKTTALIGLSPCAASERIKTLLKNDIETSD